MPIKFAEVTIIINEEENIFSSIYRYFSYENYVTDNDIIIIDFGDGFLCNTKNEYQDLKCEFGNYTRLGVVPIYVSKRIENRYIYNLFYKVPNINNKGEITLNFDIFNNFKNFKNLKKEPSQYNLIYENINKKEIFSILKICSNKEKPRFLLAYEDNVLDRNDVIYLTECIFKKKFT